MVGDLSNLEEIVKNCKDKDLAEDIDDYIKRWYRDSYKNAKTYYGKIAPIEGWGSGGGIQIELPLPTNWLEALGVLQEIN